LFSTDELAELPVLGDCFAEVDRKYPGLNYYRRRHEALRRFFGILVEDVICLSRRTLAELDPRSVAEVRHAGQMVIRFTPALWEDLKVIRGFLFKRMYRAPAVVEMRGHVTGVINDLFPLFMANPEELPKQWRKDVAEAGNETALARIVADYISGMTDRFAIQEHARLTGSDIIERTRVTSIL
jgi:dGTPase